MPERRSSPRRVAQRPSPAGNNRLTGQLTGLPLVVILESLTPLRNSIHLLLPLISPLMQVFSVRRFGLLSRIFASDRNYQRMITHLSQTERSESAAEITACHLNTNREC